MERIGAEHQNRLGTVEIAHARAELRPRQLGEERSIGAAVRPRLDVRRSERAAKNALDQVALLVRRGAADDRRGPIACLAQPGARRRERLVPARRAQLTARANQRLDDPLARLDHLEAEAALVTQPAVVDLDVVPCQHSLDPLVPDRELDVALARAQGAYGPRVLDVPGTGAEPVGLRGQGADGAELDDVAVER